METEDGTWRKAQGVDNWSIYKGDGGSLAQDELGRDARGERTGSTRRRAKYEDYSDVWNLSQKIDAPPSAAQKEWMYQNINIPEVINYMAINSVIRHTRLGLVQLVHRPRHRGHRPLGAVALGPRLDVHDAGAVTARARSSRPTRRTG